MSSKYKKNTRGQIAKEDMVGEQREKERKFETRGRREDDDDDNDDEVPPVRPRIARRVGGATAPREDGAATPLRTCRAAYLRALTTGDTAPAPRCKAWCIARRGLLASYVRVASSRGGARMHAQSGLIIYSSGHAVRRFFTEAGSTFVSAILICFHCGREDRDQ